MTINELLQKELDTLGAYSPLGTIRSAVFGDSGVLEVVLYSKGGYNRKSYSITIPRNLALSAFACQIFKQYNQDVKASNDS